MKTVSQSTSSQSGFSIYSVTLIAGDVLALLLFVVVGRLSHDMTSDWLANVARIATPFLLGWFLVAVLVGAYRLQLVSDPGQFLLRTIVSWLVGTGLALVFRVLLFGDTVTWAFALVALAFTGLFLISWRGIFLWWANR